MKITEGDKVTYITHYTTQKGIVKGVCDDENYLFVVFNCDNDWEHYSDYTGAKTLKSLLVKGWTI